MRLADIFPLNETPRARRASGWVIVMDPVTHKVLVAKRAPTSNNAGQWNFFGGNIDSGEDPLLAALRELEEESGIRPNPHDVLFSGKVKTIDHIRYFFAVYMTRHMVPQLNHESSRHRWVSVEKLMSMPNVHGPTRMILQKISSGGAANVGDHALQRGSGQARGLPAGVS